jgi:hypothetical protein
MLIRVHPNKQKPLINKWEAGDWNGSKVHPSLGPCCSMLYNRREAGKQGSEGITDLPSRSFFSCWAAATNWPNFDFMSLMPAPKPPSLRLTLDCGLCKEFGVVQRRCRGLAQSHSGPWLVLLKVATADIMSDEMLQKGLYPSLMPLIRGPRLPGYL